MGVALLVFLWRDNPGGDWPSLACPLLGVLPYTKRPCSGASMVSFDLLIELVGMMCLLEFIVDHVDGGPVVDRRSLQTC